MGEKTEIAWCDHTFNPWIGCAHASPGCDNCYAEARDTRLAEGLWGPHAPRRVTGEANWRQPVKLNRDAAAAGVRRRVFCASLADVFEDRRDLDAPRERLFALIEATPNLDWLLLTKRPWSMVVYTPRSWLNGWPRNVWAGTTVEDQKRADLRIPLLLQVPAVVRFLSCEPLLGSVDLSRWIRRTDHCNTCHEEHPPQGPDRCPACGQEGTLIATWGERQAEDHREGRRYDNGGPGPDDDGPEIHWVIVGGESGSKARPFDLIWARSLRDQCRAAGVAYFLKQFGAKPINSGASDIVGPDGAVHYTRLAGDPLVAEALRRPGYSARPHALRFAHRSGANPAEWSEEFRVQQFPEVIRG